MVIGYINTIFGKSNGDPLPFESYHPLVYGHLVILCISRHLQNDVHIQEETLGSLVCQNQQPPPQRIYQLGEWN